VRRRRFLQCAALLAAAPAWGAPRRFEHGLLWRITRKGAPASHVFGTIHEADARVAELPQPASAALERAKSLLVEFLPSPYTQERFLEAALFSDRQTLEQYIGAEDSARVREQLAPIGLAPEVVARLKPWGALINLRHSRSSDGASVDAALLERARARRMALGQIEGVEEQIFTFDECPMETQVALLRHSLAHNEELLDLADATIEAYLERDLAAIWRLRQGFGERHPEVAAHLAVMNKRVLLDRSVVMAFRMQRELRRGDAFVAVGALHLYGEKGVLALLEQDGYRAARIY
jgi:uncharacterized protein YbaP (TraB family)